MLQSSLLSANHVYVHEVRRKLNYCRIGPRVLVYVFALRTPVCGCRSLQACFAQMHLSSLFG